MIVLHLLDFLPSPRGCHEKKQPSGCFFQMKFEGITPKVILMAFGVIFYMELVILRNVSSAADV